MKWVKAVLIVALAGALGWCAFPGSAEEGGTADPALQRTRKTVQMLDDIYKTTIVLITDKYVQSDSDFPAGGAAIALFHAIKEKKWHEVKLLDVSGQPSDGNNVAKDEFEKAAVREMKAGKPYYEREEKKGEDRYLRAATAIPVVLEKCTLCHENYKQASKGQAIGMLSYTVKIE